MTEQEKNAPRPCHEAQIDELRLRCAAYQACRSPNTFPFKVGDIVTPRKGAPVSSVGEPHIVLEVFPRAEQVTNMPISSSGFGIRPQMRVLMLERTNHDYVPYMVEAFIFEHYKPAE